ncbi:hypothetical protein [Zhongshania sp.]|jgi:hypothetical protein|uniref:hypothetical protein n=1 Tax=Zhongshania sp. TaxID=1971902 RepID=UPI0039E3E678
MKTNILALSLALTTSLLVACGGGGDARSPDRPSAKLDPSTLRIEFPVTNKLAGLGTNQTEDGIFARMVALQTDGVEVNLGPELNVTEGTSWSITGPIGDPAIAGLAAAVSNAILYGKVKYILSTAFLAEPEGTISLTLNGSYIFEGRTYTATPVEFLVVPPIRVPPPSIVGPEIIAIDPLDANAIAMADYRLLNELLDLTMLENRTGEAKFCASQPFFTFAEYSAEQATALATITNPFDGTNNQEGITVIISAIDPESDCTTVTDGDPDTNPATLFAVKTVIIKPASVKSVDVCVITNPAALTCNSNGVLDQAVTPLSSCQGLDSANVEITGATLPAASTLQMVAKLNYENPVNSNQSFNRYQCRGANLLAWSSVPVPSTIYSTELNATDGTATLIGQLDYDAIRNDAAKNNSTVTASYNNSSTSIITGTLKLNLSDETVTKIDILPKIGAADPDKKYSINLSFLESEKTFTALCTYTSGQAPCGSGTVSWTVGKADTLKVSPLIGSETTAMPTTPNNPVFVGNSSLTATYKASAISDTVTVSVVDDALVALVLMQQDDTSGDPVVDEFSCLGSGSVSLNASQENGFEAGATKGSRRFFAHALFTSNTGEGIDTSNPADLTVYRDVTQVPSVVFSADVGYYDSANNTCITTPQSGDVPIPVGDISASKPAEFSAIDKGLLEAQGEARFSTMCIRVFTDRNSNSKYDAPVAETLPSEVETLSNNGATTLVQPAGTLALADQSGSACAIYEPILSGDNPLAEPVLLPLLFELGYYADPILSNLPIDQITGQLPIDQINEALMSGDLSTITDLLGGGGGLPTPPAELPGAEQIAALAEALNQETLTAIIDTCLVSEADVTTFFGTLSGGDPQAAVTGLLDGTITSDDCSAAFPIAP